MRDIKLRTCTLKSIYSSRDFLVLCIGNHMIPSAIWNKYKARVNFSKTNKLKFGVFEKLTSAYLFQKIMSLLIKNIHEEISRWFKVAKHSFQVPLPNSPLLLNYLGFGARFLQESRLTKEEFVLAFWLWCVLLP